MDELQRKIKRVKPLIRAKQATLDQEAAALEKVRSEKREAMSQLKRYERLYIDGIERLNRERQSTMREQLEVLERGVDHYKGLWYHALKSIREIESRERSQLSQLLMARQELRSMEMLEERYIGQASQVERQKEQKQNDESALRSFNKVS